MNGSRSNYPMRVSRFLAVLRAARRMWVQGLLTLLGAIGTSGFAQVPQALPADPRTLQQQRFYDIYKELIEIDTTHSAGDTTRAAQAMRMRLLEAGFEPADVQVFEPFERKGNLVLRFKGNGSKLPLLLLAHIDVVEARREDWGTDPFKLQEDGRYFTARGAIDDKAMAAAFVSVVGQLKREGFQPSRDIILALTADEERGDVPSNGLSWLLANHPAQLKAEFGINEGASGQLRDGEPVLQRVQVAEKISVTYELEVRDQGGHSAVPTPNNPIYALSAALARLGQYRFPARLDNVTRTYFSRSAALANGQLAKDMRAVGNGDLDASVLARLSLNPNYNAQLRTTCVPTMVSAGHAENALAQSAKAIVNCRLLPDDDAKDVERQLKQVLDNDKITLRPLHRALPSPASPMQGDLLKTVEALTQQMWPGVPVIPMMSAGATDSRFLRNAGIPMYGITGFFIDSADNRVHGLHERIEIRRLYEGREFLYQLVRQLAQ